MKILALSLFFGLSLVARAEGWPDTAVTIGATDKDENTAAGMCTYRAENFITSQQTACQQSCAYNNLAYSSLSYLPNTIQCPSAWWNSTINMYESDLQINTSCNCSSKPPKTQWANVKRTVYGDTNGLAKPQPDNLLEGLFFAKFAQQVCNNNAQSYLNGQMQMCQNYCGMYDFKTATLTFSPSPVQSCPLGSYQTHSFYWLSQETISNTCTCSY